MKLNVEETGQGQLTIIFVHGNSHSSEYWKGCIDYLKKHNYRCVAIDLPGNGKSPRSTQPEIDYSMAGLSQSVLSAIETYSHGKFILVGLSLGTSIVGEICQQLRNCVGVMLLSSCVMGGHVGPAEVFKPNPVSAACFMPNPTEKEARDLVLASMFQPTDELIHQVEAIYFQTDLHFRTHVGQAVAMGLYSDEVDNLKKSGIPIAVVFGEQDQFCNTDYLDKIDFPKWKNKTILIPDSGHNFPVEKPLELGSLIREFAGGL